MEKPKNIGNGQNTQLKIIIQKEDKKKKTWSLMI